MEKTFFVPSFLDWSGFEATGFLLLFFGLISFYLQCTHPVHALLCLVSVFLISASLLAIYGLGFYPLILIAVYVGAIAILFLFVVMLLNLTEKKWVSIIQKHTELLYVILASKLFVT